MDSQKFENVLNLSLNATEVEREKSSILNTGFDNESRTWELIVKYHGDIERFSSEELQVEPLIAGYAIVTIQENLVEAFAALEEVEYVEKPKRLFFATDNGKQASCILQVTLREPFLTGRGVLVGVIDSGIDYYNEHFRNPDGTSRIRSLWDQSLAPNPEAGRVSPDGFAIGVEFSQSQINAALQTGNRSDAYALIPTQDISGHGTAVAGIAVANRTGSGATQFYDGVATESELIVVKLGNQSPLGFPRTTELMRALKYVVDQALEYNEPVAINLSFGNTYGSHSGMSLIERYIDNIAEIGRTVICIGSGNEGSASGHSSGTVDSNVASRIELSVAEYETGLNIQLWKNYVDEYNITLIAPSGERQQLPVTGTGTVRLPLNGTEILAYIGELRPYSANQEIFIDMLPQERYIGSGVWTILLEPVRIVSGEYNLYLPSQTIRNISTRF